MDRDGFKKEYESLKASEIEECVSWETSDALEAWRDPRYYTLGDLLEATEEEWKREKLSIEGAVGYFGCEEIERLRKKMLLLPEMAERALNGDWEGFSWFVQLNPATMEEAFEWFYDDMPKEYRREFAIGCYMHVGDSLEACREAVKDLPANGACELPEEYRNLEELTVYRGGAEPIEEAAGYLSWTLDESVARFFQTRLEAIEKRNLYSGKIKPRDVIAYTDEREEREVIQYMSVYDIKKIG